MLFSRYNLFFQWRPPLQCSWCYAHSDNIWAAYFLWSSFITFFPAQSQPSFPYNYRQGPVGDISSWWTQLLQLLKAPLSPGFTGAQHCSLLLFGWERHFSSSSVQEQNGGQQSSHLLLLFSWLVFLHFRSVFAQNLNCHGRGPDCYIFIPLHLPVCSSQASWTNTSERDRWDIILMLSIKIYLCTDYGGKNLLPYNGNCWFNGCGSAGCRGQKLLYSKGNYALKLALFQHRW